jgi:hypothetical protein
MFLKVLLSVITVFAANEKLAETAVESIRPKTIAVRFDKKSAPIQGSLVTFISGNGHGHNLEMTSFQLSKNEVSVLKVEYGRSVNPRIFLRSSSEADRQYPEADFFYKVEEGRLSVSQFNDLLRELSKIHNLKTFAEYEVSPRNHIALDGAQTKKFVGGSAGFSFSTADFAKIVNLWKDESSGFLYGFIGYHSSESEQNALKVNAMGLVLEKILSPIKWTQVKEITPVHQKIFHHQLSVAQAYYHEDYGWWVKERVLSLAGIFGSEQEIPLLLEEFKPKAIAKNPDASTQRLKYVAASAIARISKKDFRFNDKGQPIPIEETGKMYLKEFSK